MEEMKPFAKVTVYVPITSYRDCITSHPKSFLFEK